MQPVQRIVLFLGLASLSAATVAATTVYTSPGSFMAQLAPGAYTETFDGLAATPPSTFSSGAFAYTVSAADGLYGSSGILEANQENQALTITFTSGNVFAIGGNFFATNYNDVLQAKPITLTLSDNTTATFTPTSLATSFRGFTSTAKVTSLTISAPGNSLYASLDNLTVGVLPAVVAVPEPSAAWLMFVGATGLWIARRRRT